MGINQQGRNYRINKYLSTVLTTNFYDHAVSPRMAADDDDDGELIGADDDADMANDEGTDKEDFETEDDEDEA